MSLVSLGGGKVTDARTAAQLAEAEKIAGFPFLVTQGSYNRGRVGASAGTHDLGGVLDFHTGSLSRRNKLKMVAALRSVGFAAWIRPYRPGVWPEHCHAVSIQPGGREDQGVLAWGAWQQVKAYYDGRDGLSGNNVDPHASLGIAPITWEAYQRSIAPPPPPPVTKRKVPDMVICQYGASAYRLICSTAVIGISQTAFNAFRDAGIPVVKLPVADVQAITAALGTTD